MSASTASVERALGLLEILAGRVVHGLSLNEIAELAHQIPSTTLKDLKGLESHGWAERIAGKDKCWRLTARPVRIATHHRDELARWRAQLDEIERNYSRPLG